MHAASATASWTSISTPCRPAICTSASAGMTNPADELASSTAYKAPCPVPNRAARPKQDGVAKFGGKIPPNLKLPLRDGDIDRPDDPNYADCYFVNANSKEKPGLVDRRRIPITDPLELYSGCYVRASINFFAFNTNGNKGVAAGLGNIQKWAEGEPLNGRVRAEDEFEALDAEDDDDFLS